MLKKTSTIKIRRVEYPIAPTEYSLDDLTKMMPYLYEKIHYFHFMTTRVGKIDETNHLIKDPYVDKYREVWTKELADKGIRLHYMTEIWVDIPSLYSNTLWNALQPSELTNLELNKIQEIKFGLKSYNKEDLPILCKQLEKIYNDFKSRSTLLSGNISEQAQEVNSKIFYEFINSVKALGVLYASRNYFEIMVGSEKLRWNTEYPNQLQIGGWDSDNYLYLNQEGLL